MGSNFLILSVAILMSFHLVYTGDTEGKKDCYINLEGAERHFIVYKPAIAEAKKVPVVFMFHGTSGNGEKFYRRNNFV